MMKDISRILEDKAVRAIGSLAASSTSIISNKKHFSAEAPFMRSLTKNIDHMIGSILLVNDPDLSSSAYHLRLASELRSKPLIKAYSSIPKSFLAKRTAALEAFIKGESEATESLLSELIIKVPHDFIAHQILGNLHYQYRKATPKAIEHFQKAAQHSEKISPNDCCYANICISTLQASLAETELAVEFAQRSLSKFPDLPEAQWILAKSLILNNENSARSKTSLLSALRGRSALWFISDTDDILLSENTTLTYALEHLHSELLANVYGKVRMLSEIKDIIDILIAKLNDGPEEILVGRKSLVDRMKGSELDKNNDIWDIANLICSIQESIEDETHKLKRSLDEKLRVLPDESLRQRSFLIRTHEEKVAGTASKVRESGWIGLIAGFSIGTIIGIYTGIPYLSLIFAPIGLLLYTLIYRLNPIVNKHVNLFVEIRKFYLHRRSTYMHALKNIHYHLDLSRTKLPGWAIPAIHRPEVENMNSDIGS